MMTFNERFKFALKNNILGYVKENKEIAINTSAYSMHGSTTGMSCSIVSSYFLKECSPVLTKAYLWQPLSDYTIVLVRFLLSDTRVSFVAAIAY